MLTPTLGLQLGSRQSCKNLGSVVALLQGNFEKSHDFKAYFEEKRAVLMQLQKLDDHFLWQKILKLLTIHTLFMAKPND